MTKTSCPLLYQTRWPGTETGEKPPFIRGSPDVLFIEKAADAPLMIDNDENYKTYKKSGRRLFKAPLTFERLLAAATRGRLDVETKPTDAPEHEGQVSSDRFVHVSGDVICEFEIRLFKVQRIPVLVLVQEPLSEGFPAGIDLSTPTGLVIIGTSP